MRTALALMAALMLAAPMASAQVDRPDTEDGRFVLRDVDDGVLRIDRQTGNTSICRRDDIGWACRAVPDDREALEAEIARLSDENAALARRVGRLEDELAALGEAPEPFDEDEPPAAEREPDFDLPSELELNRMMESFETMMRRFLEMIRELREDYGERG